MDVLLLYTLGGYGTQEQLSAARRNSRCAGDGGTAVHDTTGSGNSLGLPAINAGLGSGGRFCVKFWRSPSSGGHETKRGEPEERALPEDNLDVDAAGIECGPGTADRRRANRPGGGCAGSGRGKGG